MSFLICLVLLPGQRSLSNPEGAGGQSGRSSPVLRSFSMETNTRTHTHTQLHTQGGEWQTGRSCCYPFSCPHPGPGRLLKTTWCLQPKWPCLVPSQEEEPELQRPGDTEQLLPSAGTLLSVSAGNQQLVLWLLLDTSLARRTGKGHGKTD